jgi:hypothetical protein
MMRSHPARPTLALAGDHHPGSIAMTGPDQGSITPESTAPASGAHAISSSTRDVRNAALMVAAMTAGVLAGVLAWAAGELKALQVAPAERQVKFMGSGPLVPEVSPQAIENALQTNSIRVFAILGALTACQLGLAGGLATGRRQWAFIAGAIGLGLGAIVGAGIPWVALRQFQQVRAESPDALVAALAMHAALWVPIGAIAGLALAMGAGHSRYLRGMVGGALGALLATLLFEVLGATVFPFAKTDEPISLTPLTRLLARLLVATFAAAGAALAVASNTGRAKPDAR